MAYRIIPASAMRRSSPRNSAHSHFRSDIPSSSDQPQQQQQPINAAFYAPMGGAYNNSNTGYMPQGGYDNAGFFDNYSAHYYGGPETTTYTGGGGATYRGYTQPQPSPPQPYRRSRTAPPRTLPRNQGGGATATANYARYRTQRGISADPQDYRYYRSFSGPAKRPTPMYRKRRIPPPKQPSNYQETEFVDHSGYYYGPTVAGPIDQSAISGGGVYHPHHHQHQQHLHPQPATAATLRRSRYYTPSYTTYPASTMYPMPMGTVYPISNQQMEEERKAAKKRHINKRYPLLLRAALKFAQLALAAAILGLVLGPMRSYTFHDFVTRTETEWQGCIVGIVSVFGILTLILLVTLFCGYATAPWRKLDAFITGAGWFLYILVAFLEAYFAACYPPNGKNHPEVCHRAEWIIACILAFFNLIFYIIDFIMIMRTGVSLL